MAAFLSLILVLLLGVIAYFGGPAAGPFFGIVVPYAAIAIFLVGVVYRILSWANVPVPFRIPTTCGQQKTLPWIRTSRLDNPSSGSGTVIRMLLEILLFRSLFRNTQAEIIQDGPRLVFSERKFLWLAALAFHWTFLFIFLRHLRFFVEPIFPAACCWRRNWTGFFRSGRRFST